MFIHYVSILILFLGFTTSGKHNAIYAVLSFLPLKYCATRLSIYYHLAGGLIDLLEERALTGLDRATSIVNRNSYEIDYYD
jgi:hypothetical protein